MIAGVHTGVSHTTVTRDQVCLILRLEILKLVTHVFRRGATYTWRRRIPQDCGNLRKNSYIQISLRTNDPKTAQRVGGILHGESEKVFELMSSSQLSQKDAKAWLERIVREEIQRIDRRRLVELDDKLVNASEDNLLMDKLAGHAYRLLAEKGGSAAFDPSKDTRIAAENFTDGALKRGRDLLDLFGKDFWSDSRYTRTKAQYSEFSGHAGMSGLEYFELRRLMLKGKAIAYAASLSKTESSFDDSVDATVNEITRGQTGGTDLFEPDTATDLSAPPMPVTAKPAETLQANAYSSQISDIVRRLIERMRRDGATEKSCRQLEQVFSLFHEITEIGDVRNLRQHHLSLYIDTLAELPKSYRKSPKDREKSIGEILTDASSLPEDRKGLADNTVIRNLTFVSKMLKRAKSEGHLSGYEFELSDLKPRRRKRARDERRPFTKKDVQDIFENPLWIGCVSKVRRRTPGEKIIRDGRYWVPLVAALTGARREEIAGLSAQEVVEVDGIWCLQITENENRRLKNMQSERHVPIHSQLIELGFLEYAAKHRKLKGDLFPELKPSRDRTSYGDQIDNLFRKIMQQQVTDPSQKTFHSFRHYVTDVLNNLPNIKPSYRDDLLGHLSSSIGSARYGSGTSVSNLKDVVECVPRISPLLETD